MRASRDTLPDVVQVLEVPPPESASVKLRMLEHYDHVESDEKMAAAGAVVGSLKGGKK